jgi:murein L,D-transpeptidase YcbB/YkuD
VTYKNKLLGTAIALALSAPALTACQQTGSSNDSTEASGLTADEKAQEQIRQAIADAPRHGLKPDLFLKGGESGEQLVQAAVKYANALAHGYSDPKKLFEVYTIDRPDNDVRPGLQQALQQGKVGEYLNSLAPQTDEYRALGEALLRYAKQAGDRQDQTIPAGEAIKPGAQDDRIPAIAEFLRAAGYLNDGGQQPATDSPQRNTPPTAGSSNSYTPELVNAVKAYQSDSGLKPDGILGGETLESLN